MTTERKRQAARANGAESRGPVTAAGKAQSSKNSLKHGLTSAVTIILPGESEDQFRREHANLVCTLKPVNDAEAKLVEDIANLQWQMSRAVRMSSHLLNLQMDAIADSVEQETSDISPEAQIALAFQSLVETSKALPTLDRHLAHLRRQHKYLRDELNYLQTLRTETPDNEELQNEPTGEQPAVCEQLTAPQPVPAASGSEKNPPECDPVLNYGPGELSQTSTSPHTAHIASPTPAHTASKTQPQPSGSASERGSLN